VRPPPPGTKETKVREAEVACSIAANLVPSHSRGGPHAP
jgi:hypothetical protein